MIPPQHITTQEGKDVVLECNATGAPKPSIDWLFDGRVLLREVGETLQRRNVRRTAHGVYTCRASNKEGNISTSGTMLVVEGA